MRVEIEDIQSGGMVYHYITTITKDEMEQTIDSLFQRYNPAGYDTWLRQKPRYDREHGVWKATVSRYSSCE